MKIRTDFVTNSSSSSFVIAIKGIKEIRENIENYDPAANAILSVFIKMFIEQNDSYSTREELAEHVLDWLCIDTLEEMHEDDHGYFDRWFKLVDEGYTIVKMKVEYGNDDMYDLLDNLNDGENFIQLEKD